MPSSTLSRQPWWQRRLLHKYWRASLVLGAYVVGLTYAAKQENLAELKSVWPFLFLSAPFVYGFLQLGPLDRRSLIHFLFLAWVIYTLSFLSKQRRNIPRMVIGLIAGISLLDGMLIAAVQGPIVVVWLTVAAFLLTLSFQRFIRGT